MKAKFIGKDNSKGKSHLWLYDMNLELYCPYSRMETMLENWKLIEEI